MNYAALFLYCSVRAKRKRDGRVRLCAGTGC